MAPKKQPSYPRVQNIKDPDIKETIRLLWDQTHTLTDQHNTTTAALTAAQATITSQAATLVTMAKQITQVQAGGGISTKSTAAGGSSGGTGGSAPGTPGGGTPPAPPTDIPNQSGVVAQAKADLIAGGIDIVTVPCGPFQITNLAAFRLGGNYGILSKTSGNNCNGASVDIIAVKPTDGNPQMPIYDVLVDAGGANGPSWSFNSFVDSSKWMAPVTPPI